MIKQVGPFFQAWLAIYRIKSNLSSQLISECEGILYQNTRIAMFRAG